jgi:hypothetical protein
MDVLDRLASRASHVHAEVPSVDGLAECEDRSHRVGGVKQASAFALI